MPKVYTVDIDNEDTSGVRVVLEVTAQNAADENVIEPTIAEAVRRVVASLSSTPMDNLLVKAKNERK